MNQSAAHSEMPKAFGIKSFYDRPDVDKRWHGSPRRHNPSSSKLDSITKGGDKDVTTRNTERALVDSPETTMSPPGLHGERRFMSIKNEASSIHCSYQTIVSKWTFRPNTKPTRLHLVLSGLSDFGGRIVGDFFKSSRCCCRCCALALLYVGTKLRISKFDIRDFSTGPPGSARPVSANITASLRYLCKRWKINYGWPRDANLSN